MNLTRTHHLVCKNNLHILYYNARSLLPKFDDLMLSVINLHPHIICIVETWLSSDIIDHEIYIPGFQLYRYDRNRHGGGVLVYVSNMFFVSVLSPSLLLKSLPFPFFVIPLSFIYVYFIVHPIQQVLFLIISLLI